MINVRAANRGLGHSLQIINNSVADLGKAYREAPYGIERFAEDIIGIELNHYQKRILRALMVHKRVCVRGLHGIGKTTIAATVNLWGMGAFQDDLKIVNTASKWRQIRKYLFPEIHKWARLTNWQALGMTMRFGREIQTLSLKSTGKEAFGVACTDPTAIEGAHAKNLIYILDESKAIPDATFDAVEGAFSNAGENGYVAYALSISTPAAPIGRFYDIQSHKEGYEDWHTEHVTLEDAIKAGRVSQQWADNRKRQWGEGDPRYKNRVLAEFADSSEDTLISLSWVEAAQERLLDRIEANEIEGDLAYGVDVARKGQDSSAVARKLGYNVTDLNYYDYPNTMRLAGTVIRTLDKDSLAQSPKTVPIGVDDVGVGGGVADRLKELQYKVIEVTASARSKRRSRFSKDRFDNLRSELWWLARELLNPNHYKDDDGNLDESEMLALPMDDKLVTDLTTPKWEELSDGRIRVEGKKDIERRLKREGRKYKSSDGADAVLASLHASKKLEAKADWVSVSEV